MKTGSLFLKVLLSVSISHTLLATERPAEGLRRRNLPARSAAQAALAFYAANAVTQVAATPACGNTCFEYKFTIDPVAETIVGNCTKFKAPSSSSTGTCVTFAAGQLPVPLDTQKTSFIAACAAAVNKIDPTSSISCPLRFRQMDLTSQSFGGALFQPAATDLGESGFDCINYEGPYNRNQSVQHLKCALQGPVLPPTPSQCISARTFVLRLNPFKAWEPTPIMELKNGDTIAALSDTRIVASEVLEISHREYRGSTDFVSITTEDQTTVRVTPLHFVYRALIVGDMIKSEPIQARNMKVGDFILAVDPVEITDQDMPIKKITNITYERSNEGFTNPVTTKDNLLISSDLDGPFVMVSSYSAMNPRYARYLNKLRRVLFYRLLGYPVPGSSGLYTDIKPGPVEAMLSNTYLRWIDHEKSE